MSSYLGFEPTENREYFFLSYNNEDAPRLSGLACEMDRSGIPLWYDDGIEYGEEWARLINRMIAGAQAVVILFTRGILEKEKSYVQREYKIAKKLNKKIIILFVEDIADGEVPVDKIDWWVEITDLHCFSLSGLSGRETVIREIRKALGLEAAGRRKMPEAQDVPEAPDMPEAAAEAEPVREEDRAVSAQLEKVLDAFGVKTRVVHVTHGPVAVRYELELGPFARLGRIPKLEAEVAYALSASSVRIEAPIPGTALVGVEVSNREPVPVLFRNLMESPGMRDARSILAFPLGLDIEGRLMLGDLEKMPHLLVHGQAGSGKTMVIHSLVGALLSRAGPEEVRLVLADPGMRGLEVYDGVPHLQGPVLTDPQQALSALEQALKEMAGRFDLLAGAKVRNLDHYNKRAETVGGLYGIRPLPRIVIIIEELTDLMKYDRRKTEELVCRLAQLGAAVGIHLAATTQRASVDVLTGLVKANIPARISFRAASEADSRGILDQGGAEKLGIPGDMLYLARGALAPVRIRGCLLEGEEIRELVRKARGEAEPG